MISREQRDRLRALHVAATGPGRWKPDTIKHVGDNWLIGFGHDDRDEQNWIVTTDGIHSSELMGEGARADAIYVAEAHNHLVALLDALDAAEAELLELRQARFAGVLT